MTPLAAFALSARSERATCRHTSPCDSHPNSHLFDLFDLFNLSNLIDLLNLSDRIDCEFVGEQRVQLCLRERRCLGNMCIRPVFGLRRSHILQVLHILLRFQHSVVYCELFQMHSYAGGMVLKATVAPFNPMIGVMRCTRPFEIRRSLLPLLDHCQALCTRCPID